nr:signal peptidase complex catalytic subunit SEC11A-like [Quercus suber]
MGWIRNTVDSVKSRRIRPLPQLVNLGPYSNPTSFLLLLLCVSKAACFLSRRPSKFSFLSSVIILSEGLACLAGADSPGSLLGVAISESMEPGIKRGDLMFLKISKDPIHAGEIILFNVDGLDVPISHRVTTVHGHRNTGKVYILTKGDNNHLDDRILYARGQRWLLRPHVIARVIGLLPYVGWIKLILTENPIIKYIVWGTLTLLIATSKN